MRLTESILHKLNETEAVKKTYGDVPEEGKKVSTPSRKKVAVPRNTADNKVKAEKLQNVNSQATPAYANDTDKVMSTVDSTEHSDKGVVAKVNTKKAERTVKFPFGKTPEGTKVIKEGENCNKELKEYYVPMEYRDYLIDAIEGGNITWDEVGKEAVEYMSVDDLAKMVKDNDWEVPVPEGKEVDLTEGKNCKENKLKESSEIFDVRNEILAAADEGFITWEQLAVAAVKYMSSDDVAGMCKANEFNIPTSQEEFDELNDVPFEEGANCTNNKLKEEDSSEEREKAIAELMKTSGKSREEVIELCKQFNGEETNECDKELKEDVTDNHLAEVIEGVAPRNMRFKYYEFLDDGTLYWVTQDTFTSSDVDTFVKGLKDAGVTKAGVTVRDLSHYNYQTDKERDMLVNIDLSNGESIVAGKNLKDSMKDVLGDIYSEETNECDKVVKE